MTAEMRPVRPTTGDSSWFTQGRFGMFIHWGLYSLGARHEWLQSNEYMSKEEYSKYFKRFDPDLYDPNLWADLAQEAGMTYSVITTKHHDGFCLWDTKYTDFKSTNTPAGRDLIQPYVDAFRSRGLGMGLYYSLLDWHHPDYTLDDKHPMRKNKEYAVGDAGRNFDNYVDYMMDQTKELLTEYGKVDLMFFDFSFPSEGTFPGRGKLDWQSERLVKQIRELQPHILLNDRLQYGGDITTPEQYQPSKWIELDKKRVVWEACHTFSGSWGYHRDEKSWKSVEMLVKMLVDTVSKGGNLLLNVGPTGRGEIDIRAIDRLKGMGAWMKVHNRSIYGCTAAPDDFTCPEDCRLTYNPATNRMYVHVFSWPFRFLNLSGFSGRVEYAQLLNDASEVQMVEFEQEIVTEQGSYNEGRAPGTLTLGLPVKKPECAVPVIELFLK